MAKKIWKTYTCTKLDVHTVKTPGTEGDDYKHTIRNIYLLLFQLNDVLNRQMTVPLKS